MSFSIAGRNLKLDSAADIQPHLDELNAIPDLTEVHFGGNTLGVPACEALAAVLATKKTLRIADFADIFTGRLISEIPQALKALCDSLAENEALVELDLSDNAFGGRSAEPMVHFLKTNRHYSVLKLNNNGLGVTGGSIVAKALIEAAEAIKSEGGTSQLRTVICGRNRLENGSAPLWAEAFAKHGGLREVRMFQNGIRMEGIEAISRGLSQCKGLEVLDLQDNTATLRGSRAIAAALPNWPELKVLNLSDMLLKPKGGMLVAEALAKGGNTKLETLQLQYDDIDRKGLAALGGAIKRHLSALTKLEINGNWADEDDECITSIKEALEAHGHEDALDELDELDPEGEESEAEEDDEHDEEDKEDEEEEKAEATKPEDTKAQAPTAPSSTEAAPIAASAAGAAALATGAAAAATANASSTEQKDTASSKLVEAIKDDEKAAPAPVHATTDTAPPSTSLPASASEMQVDSQTQSARAAAHAESSASGPSADQQLVELMGNVGFGQGEKKKKEAAPVAAAAAGVTAVASAAAATSAAVLSAPTKEEEKKDAPVPETKSEQAAAALAAASAEPAAPTAHAPLSGEAAPQAPAPGPAEVAAPVEAPTQAVGPSGEGKKKESLPVVETEEERKPATKDPITVAAPAATQEEIKAPAAQPQARTEPQNQAAAATPALAPAAPGSAQVTPSKHAQQGSLDLNDELYAAPAAASSSAAPAPAPAQGQAQAAQETAAHEQQQQQQKKKRGGLKAAFGAVKELLFK